MSKQKGDDVRTETIGRAVRPFRYLSVCAGIEAATVAWHPLGWEPAAFSEIDAFPRAVLSHHYPDVPLHGDFTTIGADDYGPIDLLVGGTPCQSFSFAGLRGGMADDRGKLALEYLRLADRKRAKWLVWENVPGCLSSNKGRDFGSFLGGLAELGYGFAYRVLDAQYFGVAQRRRRVFVVGYLGDWRPPAYVLFERHSFGSTEEPARPANDVWAFDNGLSLSFNMPIGHDLIPCLIKTRGYSVAYGRTVRNLTPVEEERATGFPDNYTLVPFRGKMASNSARYAALGNSMATPVMRWLGRRIQQSDLFIDTPTPKPVQPDFLKEERA